MITSKVNVAYLNHMGDDLTVVNAARVSFNKFKEKFDDKDEKLLEYLAKHEHLTPFEHLTLTVLIECPLPIRSQIMRHRTFAYNEISRRYTDEDIQMYIFPVDDMRNQAKNNKQGSEGQIVNEKAILLHTKMQVMAQHLHNFYNELIDMGLSKEQARFWLPQSTMTKFWMSGNIRNFIHFVKLRIDSHAQKEAQYVGQQVLEILKEKFPISTSVLMKY